MEEQTKEVKKKAKPKCKKCNSSFGYLKIKEKAWQCRTCGYLDKEVKL